MTDPMKEAARLISCHIDGVMSEDEQSRLAALMRQDSGIVELYVDMMLLDGHLTWGAVNSPSVSSERTTDSSVMQTDAGSDSSLAQWKHGAVSASVRKRQWSRPWSVTLGVVLIAVCVPGLFRLFRSFGPVTSVGPSATRALIHDPSVEDHSGDELSQSPELNPLHFDSLTRPIVVVPSVSTSDTADRPDVARNFFREGFSDEDIIAAINQQISQTLRENGIPPSPRAPAEEWARRAWLTVAGRIPSVDEIRSTPAGTESESRRVIMDRLLHSPERSRRLAEVWTGLLVGRSGHQRINRSALMEYLYDAFLENRPWITVVGQLISAEGSSDDNGATNFLLAHLDNQATPATAVTARLFLGEQLQCVQCHNHPFAQQVQQQDYWALNAFFQNAEATLDDVGRSTSSRQDQTFRLADRRVAGMTFYETRNGRQEAVVPAYDGRKIPAESSVHRRVVLAEYLATDSQLRVARAMINRMWAEFFGFGFTSRVDDMGPHAAVSHPQLLGLLSDAFVASGYDLQRLQRWIALSDAWQCSSQATPENEQDAPESGILPLFSRVYMRRMSPEQVYDSIRVAIRAVSMQTRETAEESDHRRRWINQFARPYDTDENDETNEFVGGITQAMVMMNDADVNSAIRRAIETLLARDDLSSSVDRVLEQVSLAVLTRRPTSRESALFRQYLKRTTRSAGRRTALPQVTEDLLWTYLNSSEFQLIH
ncbi:MAG: DUF1549 and DUF1553 domain-containing protein [Fuerstiella sp.]|nr:DUF1549 and DUF1553 domain-containing protein [Fuerstiella sp.]